MVELRMLKNFVGVAERLHFRKASEALNISQSAVSRSIAHLEEQLGCLLLSRDTQGVALTEAGKEYLKYSLEILALVDKAKETVREITAHEKASVKIAYTGAAMGGKLPELIASFAQSFSEMSIDLTYAWSDRQVDLIKLRKVHVGFVHGLPDNADIDGKLVWRERLVAVVPDDHPLAQYDRVEIAKLKEESFILGVKEEWRPLREQIERVCGHAGFQPKTVDHKVSLRDGIFALVAAGAGVTLYPLGAISSTHKGIKFLSVEDDVEQQDIYMIWHRGTENAAKAFIKHVAKLIDSETL